MEEYKSIKYSYSKRTKRYTIIVKHADAIYKAVKKIIVNKNIDLLILKVKDNHFDIYEFFLLELLYVLEILKHERMELAVDIGGITINDLLDFLKEKTWLADRYKKPKIDIFDYNIIKQKMVYDLLPHQKDAFKEYEIVKQMANLRGYMLNAEAGMGKTFTSLAMSEALYYNNVIIIAPGNTIEEVWVDSIAHSLYKTQQPYFVYNSNNKDYKKERFFITHYESLEKLAKDKKLLRLFKRLKPILIIDEFHNFNNIKAKRTQSLLEFINYIDFEDILLLTGTPIKMDMKELEPMLYVLDRKFPPVVDRFKQFYGSSFKLKYDLLRYRFNMYRKHIPKFVDKLPPIEIKELRVKIPDGDRFLLSNIKLAVKQYKEQRLAEIMENMDTYESQFESTLQEAYMNMLNNGISKTESNRILSSYKSKVKKIRKHSKLKKLYEIQPIILEVKEMEQNIILPYLSSNNKKIFKDIRSIIKYPELKVLGEALGKIILGARIDAYNNLAKYLNYRDLLELTDKKGIVFSNYISTCEFAIKKAIEDGYSPIGVYGNHIENLPKYVKQFNDLKSNINPIVATYKSLSTGVPLTAGNIMIMLDIPVRLYLLDQSISRAWRIGQDKPVIVFMIKLDTGNNFNITDRDHYILNLSKQNVEFITGNNIPYEIPIQLDEIEDEEEDENEVIDKITEDVEYEIEKNLIKEVIGNIGYNKLNEEPDSLLYNIKNKIKYIFK